MGQSYVPRFLWRQMRIRRCYLLLLHLLSMLSVLSGAKIANKMDKDFKIQIGKHLGKRCLGNTGNIRRNGSGHSRRARGGTGVARRDSASGRVARPGQLTSPAAWLYCLYPKGKTGGRCLPRRCLPFSVDIHHQGCLALV